MSETCTGWLLDVYPNAAGVTLWLLADDGRRLRLEQDFPVTFYAAGPDPRLRQLWRALADRPERPRLSRSERRDVFKGHIPVLAVEVPGPEAQPGLFREISEAFPDLTYYDADLNLSLRYTAQTGAFPLARCLAEVDGGHLQDIRPLDTPWDLEPLPPPLRILTLEPDANPSHEDPGGILFGHDGLRYRMPLAPERALLINLRAVLERYDPDLVLTAWGDTWLLPRLQAASHRLGLQLPLSREAGRGVVERKEHTYFSYGQIIYRGRQVQFFGRWHLDRHNAMLWGDYGIEGVLEMARLTGLSVQDAGRLSPGTGISAMQFLTALRQDILIPWHKQQAEAPKTALDLLHADMGGMVYQPTIGLHRDVAGIDFVSMYPGIMVRFNISPEVPRASAEGLAPAPGEPGIVPQTLAPLLQKRLALKAALADMRPRDPRREAYEARTSTHKWLLVTCFGYLGYKNARFGRIEAHEAVTAYSREALLRAKEAAEALDFTVLHMYVDGLWVQKPGCRAPQDFQPLLAEIIDRTGLPIALDGIYRWIVFLPSRLNERVPVPNRYFGVFQDGSVKVRGIECRRRDTPPFIAGLQQELLQLLARVPDASRLPEALPEARLLVRRKLEALRSRRVPPEELLVSQKLSRELDEYHSPSPAARAVRQLQAAGKTVRPGQRVRFLYTLGEPGVCAWDAPASLDPRRVDLPRYRVLLLRAARTILEPIEKECCSEKSLAGDHLPIPLPYPVGVSAFRAA